MKKIENSDELKNCLKEILYYFDRICKKNNIKYSLIGGSLIGAIRHHDIIPWDDDIDVILTPNNYKKLVHILKKNTESDYYLLDSDNLNYNYPFAKLVYKKTFLKESAMNAIENYGLYLDIFEYNYISDNEKKRRKIYKKLKNYKRLIRWLNYEKNNNIKCNVEHFIATLIGKKRILAKYNNLIHSEHKKTNYIISNWPGYGYDKEVQLAKNVEDYIQTKFGSKNVMIFKNYDEILTTTFGNYMELPPVEKQISNHNFVAYWREDNNDNA